MDVMSNRINSHAKDECHAKDANDNKGKCHAKDDSIIYDKYADTFIVKCPHCFNLCSIAAKDIRCKIFRHGILKSTMKPIPPHSSKELCDYLAENALVYGCAKPFMFDGNTIEKCDYI